MALQHEVDLEERAKDALPPEVAETVDAIDLRIARWADKYGITLLRLTIGVVYVWFGVLKVIDRSPVEEFVRDVAFYLPDSVVVPAMGGWEIIIGLGLIFPVALRLTLAMLWVQLIGTLSAFVVVPGQCFQDYNPLLLTTEGEFVLKNLVLIAAGVVIGSTVRVRARRANAPR
jgi:uncharacterized membrane protein YkgB